MFSVYCETHEAHVLLGAESITHVANTSEGIVVSLECYCGAQLQVLTGGQTTDHPRVTA